MLAVILLYAGIVLIQNGLCRIYNVDAKSCAVMNGLFGVFSLVCNVILLCFGVFAMDTASFYYAAAGMLFSFTYLFIACVNIYNLDARVLGYYCLFVAINTLPAAYMSFSSGDSFQASALGVMWLLWGILWLFGFLECSLDWKLAFVPHLTILGGIFTTWIPSWLFFLGIWE